MSGKHIFPPTEKEFNDYVDIVIPYLDANAARLAVSKENTSLTDQLKTDWESNWLLYTDDTKRTTAVIAAKNSPGFLFL